MLRAWSALDCLGDDIVPGSRVSVGRGVPCSFPINCCLTLGWVLSERVRTLGSRCDEQSIKSSERATAWTSLVRPIIANSRYTLRVVRFPGRRTGARNRDRSWLNPVSSVPRLILGRHVAQHQSRSSTMLLLIDRRGSPPVREYSIQARRLRVEEVHNCFDASRPIPLSICA